MTKQKSRAPTPPAGTAEVLYGEQTRLALANFAISGQRLPSAFVRALGLIKACAARVNGDLGLLPADLAGLLESLEGA